MVCFSLYMGPKDFDSGIDPAGEIVWIYNKSVLISYSPHKQV